LRLRLWATTLAEGKAKIADILQKVGVAKARISQIDDPRAKVEAVAAPQAITPVQPLEPVKAGTSASRVPGMDALARRVGAAKQS
jgi:hypothetical protein